MVAQLWSKIDCEDLKVILKDEKGMEVCFYGQREQESCCLISALKASCYVKGVLDIGEIGRAHV